MPCSDEVILLLPTANDSDEVILLMPKRRTCLSMAQNETYNHAQTFEHICNPAFKVTNEKKTPEDELSRSDETTDFHKQSNTRKCGRCGVIGHYKNNCPASDFLPKKKTSTWNMTHKSHAIMKYTCECGKKEMSKCNLDRHKKNHHAGLIHLR